jgi:hypothetical protein
MDCLFATPKLDRTRPTALVPLPAPAGPPPLRAVFASKAARWEANCDITRDLEMRGLRLGSIFDFNTSTGLAAAVLAVVKLAPFVTGVGIEEESVNGLLTIASGVGAG